MIDLFNKGVKTEKIGKIMGLSTPTVQQYLNSEGIDTTYSTAKYLNRYANDEEKLTRKYLEKKGYEVIRCMFMCQRDKVKVIPSIIKDKYCKKCPIKNIKFHKDIEEYYDYVCFKNNKVKVVEVKKIYYKKTKRRNFIHRTGHCSLGQLLNIGKLLKNNVEMCVIYFDEGVLNEREI